MAYVIIGRDDSAAALPKGVRNLIFTISALSDLGSDAEIIKAPDGCFYVLAGDVSVGCKDPTTHQWILPAATPILITSQPADVSTTAGAITESLSVSCYAQDSTANHACTYQWYSNNSEDYTTPTTIEGATSATYAIPTDTAAGTYYYFCTITANGKTLNSAISTVTVAAEA